MIHYSFPCSEATMPKALVSTVLPGCRLPTWARIRSTGRGVSTAPKLYMRFGTIEFWCSRGIVQNLEGLKAGFLCWQCRSYRSPNKSARHWSMAAVFGQDTDLVNSPNVPSKCRLWNVMSHQVVSPRKGAVATVKITTSKGLLAAPIVAECESKKMSNETPVCFGLRSC